MFNVDYTINESILITMIDIVIWTQSIFLAILANYNNPKPAIRYMTLSIHVFEKKKKFFF